MGDRQAQISLAKAKLAELQKKRGERAKSRSSPTKAVAGEDLSHFVESVLASTPVSTASAGATTAAPVGASRPGYSFRKAPKALSSTEVRHEDIPPTEVIHYNKEVQTLPVPELEPKEKPDDDEKKAEAESTPEPQEEKKEEEEEAKAEEPAKELSPEEVSSILNTSEFLSFFDKSSKLVERILNVKYDPLVDYSANDEEEEGDIAPGDAVRLAAEFQDTRWTAGRAVTCIDWSPRHPELLAASYTANPDNPSDPDGAVLLWNMHLKDRPEYRFECQSAVLSTLFAPYQHNIIVGGTYSGQVVLWDTRAKRTPVQRSALTSSAHTHPIYSMDIVGTQNAHNLITVSTDGKLCSWSLDMLNEPQETIDLSAGQAKSVAATCLSFPVGDINNFVLGSEEGAVYQACRHGAKAGVGQPFEAHTGPITGVDFHKGKGNSEFSHLFLTSSTDWTVKLWSFRYNKPLYSFENSGDYVYDVQWSPTHPALFANVDGQGNLELWNLNSGLEVPVAAPVVGGGKQALNRIKWAKDGKSIAVGDADGKIYVYDINERLSHPRVDEWSRFKDTLQDIQTQQAESEKAAVTSSSATSSASSAAASAAPATTA